MIKLDDLNLVDILPDSLKQDEVTLAIAEVANDEFKRLLKETEILNPKTAPPAFALDMVAYEEHVDFYDVNLPEEQKRALIENAELVHKRKGTPWAIEEVASIFFKNAKLREWFEYGGRPFRFKIETEEDIKNESDIPVLLRLIYAHKRRSTRLDAIWFRKSEGTYFQIVHDDRIRIKPVIKFRSGIVMPGSSTNSQTRIIPSTRNGISVLNFTGEIYAGKKSNDAKTGVRTASLATVLQKNSHGYSPYRNIEFLLGDSMAETSEDISFISSGMKNGTSQPRFCGKFHVGKGW